MFNHAHRPPRMASALALTLVLALAWPGGLVVASAKSAPKTKQSYASGQFLVKFKPGTKSTKIAAINKANRVKQKSRNTRTDVRVLKVPKGKTVAQMVARYKKNPNVEFAEPDQFLKATMVPNDPYYPRQWAPAYVNSPAAWDRTTGSSAVTIAVLDTGVDLTHPDFTGRVVAGYDFINGDSSPMDDNGHGTRAAGVAAATGNNGLGVAGMDWNARILPVKVLSATGTGATSIVAQGITYAADKGARVISLSLGGDGSSTMQSAVRYAYSKGCVITAASGNENSGVPIYPAGYAEVIAVGSANFDVRSTFSNYGPHLDVVAPGEGIDTTALGGGYGRFSGTSAATPFVAGLASLIMAHSPSATPSTVMSAIMSSARDLGSSGWDQYYGWGHIDAANALIKVSGEPAPAPEPAPATQPDPEPLPEPEPAPAPVDSSAPEVALTSPSTGTYVSSTVAVEATASDDTGVAKVEFWLGTKLLGSDTTAPYAVGWNTTKVANGEYTIQAKAIDVAGKSAASTPHKVTVSNVKKVPIRK